MMMMMSSTVNKQAHLNQLNALGASQPTKKPKAEAAPKVDLVDAKADTFELSAAPREAVADAQATPPPPPALQEAPQKQNSFLAIGSGIIAIASAIGAGVAFHKAGVAEEGLTALKKEVDSNKALATAADTIAKEAKELAEKASTEAGALSAKVDKNRLALIAQLTRDRSDHLALLLETPNSGASKLKNLALFASEMFDEPNTPTAIAGKRKYLSPFLTTLEETLSHSAIAGHTEAFVKDQATEIRELIQVLKRLPQPTDKTNWTEFDQQIDQHGSSLSESLREDLKRLCLDSDGDANVGSYYDNVYWDFKGKLRELQREVGEIPESEVLGAIQRPLAERNVSADFNGAVMVESPISPPFLGTAKRQVIQIDPPPEVIEIKAPQIPEVRFVPPIFGATMPTKEELENVIAPDVISKLLERISSADPATLTDPNMVFILKNQPAAKNEHMYLAECLVNAVVNTDSKIHNWAFDKGKPTETPVTEGRLPEVCAYIVDLTNKYPGNAEASKLNKTLHVVNAVIKNGGEGDFYLDALVRDANLSSETEAMVKAFHSNPKEVIPVYQYIQEELSRLNPPTLPTIV